MSGTSESEIRRLLTDLGIVSKFIGTFDRRFSGFVNNFGHMNDYRTAIVNTGFRETGGVHWLALAWDPNLRVLHIFDPLGWKDDQLKKYYDGFSYSNIIRGTAGRKGCVIMRRNKEAVQCSCSGACGLFCVLFLYAFHKFPSCPEKYVFLDRMNGESPKIRSNDWHKMHENQNILYEFLSKYSHFFRSNKANIVGNTRLNLMYNHQ